MDAKTPVVLLVLIDARRLRWFVAEAAWNHDVCPLLRSDEGDLSPCQELEGEDRVAFLRHRFSGVLQRGCNLLWARMKKPCRIVFVFDGRLGADADTLERRTAEHFVEWMANPPVQFLMMERASSLDPAERLYGLAGDSTTEVDALLTDVLPRVLSDSEHPELWELSQKQQCRPTA